MKSSATPEPEHDFLGQSPYQIEPSQGHQIYN